EIGIRTYEDLLTKDSATLVAELRERRRFVPRAEVDRWKYHAKSFSTSVPVIFGDPLTLEDPFLALDFEYEPGGLIWLIGICLVRQGYSGYHALWTDSATEEESNLRTLAEIADANPLLPVVTWNGNGADMPQLRDAVQRIKLGQQLQMVESRHFDLLQYARNGARFPISQLALDQVARYFAIPKVSRIRDGHEALFVYQQYRNSRDETKRVALKAELLKYNRDDLEALVGVAKHLAGLQSGTREAPAGGLAPKKAQKSGEKGIRESWSRRPRKKARLTWIADDGIGDFGGYNCKEADYQIERKDPAGRQFVLYVGQHGETACPYVREA